MEAVYLNSFRIALPAASVAKCPALPPPDDKVGAEVQQDVGVDVRSSGVRSRERLGS